MPPPAPGRNMDAVTLSRLHSQQDILSRSITFDHDPKRVNYYSEQMMS